jgi:hypothetical protein
VPGFATVTVGRNESMVDRLFDTRSHVLGIIAGNDFDLHFEVVHLMQSCQRYLKLIDSSKVAITAV